MDVTKINIPGSFWTVVVYTLGREVSVEVGRKSVEVVVVLVGVPAPVDSGLVLEIEVSLVV